MAKVAQVKKRYDDESVMNDDISKMLLEGWRVVCMLELMHIYVIYEIDNE